MNRSVNSARRLALPAGRGDRGLLVAATASGIVFSAFTLVLADGALEGDDLSSFDAAVTTSVVAARTGPGAVVAEAVTSVGSEVSIGLLTVGLVAWIVVRHRSWRAAGIVGVAMGLAGALTLATKHLVLRTRPPAVDVWGSLDSGYSFPSGHTLFTTVFCGLVAGLVLFRSRRFWVRFGAVSGWLVVSVGVGVSRLYLGYHWLTDILAGWSLGLLILTFAAGAAILTSGDAGQRAREGEDGWPARDLSDDRPVAR